MNRRPLGSSVIRVSFHDLLETVPVRCWLSCAPAAVNAAEPKSASGSVRHELALMHSDGASVIHSAELMSIGDARTTFVTDRCLVRSDRTSTTLWPVTVTLADIVSPSETGRASGFEGAG